MAQKIIISCDTTIAFSKEEIDSYQLNVIPLNAIVDNVEYHDSVNIDTLQLCKMMRNQSKVTTSTPTIIEIEKYFNQLFEKTQADVIIHFTISSKLSSMFSLFTNICKEKYGDKVKVVDSLSLCQWMANQVLYACELTKVFNDPDKIIETVQKDLLHSESCVFVPESIEYLKRGGRVSKPIARIANLIGVLPILCFENGEVGKKGLTRTMQKAFINAINEWKEKIKDLKENYDFIVVYADKFTIEQENKIKSLIDDYAPNMNYMVKRLSLNVTAHAGPGTIGLGIIKKVPNVN